MVIKFNLPTWENRHHIWFVLVLLVIGLPVAWFSPPLFVEDVYVEGMRIEAEDSAEARIYWEKEAGRGNLDAYVGLSRIYEKSDHKKAKHYAEYAAKHGKGLTRARAFYMAGSLAQSGLSCLELVANYGEAMREYERQGHRAGAFKSCVRLTEAYFACNRKSDARGMYRQAQAMTLKTHNEKVDLYLIGAKLVWDDNRQAAIVLGESAIDACTDERDFPRLWTSVGLLHIIGGDRQRGKDLTDKAYEVKKHPYVTINYLALELCNGGDGAAWLPEIQAEIDGGVEYLGRLLKWIKEACQ